MAGTFSYRDALEQGCFLQVPLFGPDELRTAANARGFSDFSHLLSWEPLDREGFLPPVAYIRHAGVPAVLHRRALEEGALILRDEHGYHEWSEELRPLYAHWQLLSIADLHETLGGRPPLVMLAGETKQLADDLATRAKALRDPEYPSRIVVHHRHRELLLTRTQSLFMPIVRGSYKVEPVIDRHGEKEALDTEEWVRRARRELDYEAAAEECGVSADDIRDHHEALMMKVERLDPLREWRDLVDQIERRRIEQLTGDARRAQDLYDAAEILRLWHQHLTGEGNLLEEWYDGRSFRPGQTRQAVNKARNGFERLRGNRAALPGILDTFGLYPWKVLLITEGQGDVAMLETIVSYHMAGATFDELGIVPHVVKGSPKKRDQRLLELLGALRRFPNYFLFVSDNEGTAPTWATRLEHYNPEHAPFSRASLLEPEPEPVTPDDQPPEGWSDAGYVAKRRPEAEIWSQDLEADNFTESELCDAICRLAQAQDRPGFGLALGELKQARRKSQRGMATVAQELAKAKGYRFRKPDLDAELGRYAAENPLLEGRTRRVLVVAEHLYRLTVASRMMRGRLREREREAAAADPDEPPP